MGQKRAETLPGRTSEAALDCAFGQSGIAVLLGDFAGEHGADAGWAGFTYTVDAATFYRENDEQIDAMLAEDADSYGYASVAAFVASFNCADMADTRDARDNLLAWYALETIGRMLEDGSLSTDDEDDD